MDRAIGLSVAMLFFSGCASSAAPPPPVARPFDDVHRVAIIVSGESAFAVAEDRVEPGRTFDEILKWHPYGGALRPVAKLVHRAINKVRDADQATTAARNVDGVSPGSTVAQAMARTLEGSGGFKEIRILEREPSGEDRPRDDGALVRVTVPAWGIIRVREGDPDLVSGFADVQAHMVMGRTGVVVWDGSEHVTHPESAPLASFVDERTSEILLTRRYVGIKRRDIDKASEDAHRETMDAALARTMHDLATDPELAKVLASVRTAVTVP